ncbi:hypothetical protein BH10ACT1_BH10ACT1_11430 [soil metagenome]
MKPRHVALLLVVVALFSVMGALWLGLSAGASGGTSCGPVVTQRGAKSAACHGFFRVRYIEIGALCLLAAVTYLASVVIERRVLEPRVAAAPAEVAT